MTNSLVFFNRCFDKKRLKNFILWFFYKYGTYETVQLIENLKKIGFQYATDAGISIGIDDLKIPRIKSKAVHLTEKKIQAVEINYLKGNVSEIERQQQFIEEWNFVSDTLKNNVIQFFKTTDIFNPIYMMAFSGARGNISQVRQLIGMRGLMVDPQGQLLDFPIRSNFREGLNLTEYIISCYGARKGVVDTALRTATSGYLTRRLVDVAQQVIIGQRDCGTSRGIRFKNLLDGSKTLLTLRDRLIGRILLKDVLKVNPLTNKTYKLGVKNQEISSQLAFKLSHLPNPVFLRSPLTCRSKNALCQMCYGWSLAHSTIVSIGEAVGVLAAQSIGEPGTQLTMRTFHTGGVFTGSFIDRIFAPFDGIVEYLDPFQGLLIRNLNGQIGFLTKTEGRLHVKKKDLTVINLNSKKHGIHDLSLSAQYKSSLINKKVENFLLKIRRLELRMKNNKKFSTSCLIFNIPLFTTLLIRHGNYVCEKNLIAELSSTSFLTNQRQETERDIFSPVSGQIFFDDLVLIEKITRDGNLQRLTYGLGSIWVIAGAVWKNVCDQNNIPLHGDIIENCSTIQKFKILIEQSYYLDLKLSNLMQKFRLFKFNFFSTNRLTRDPKIASLNNFIFRRDFLYLNFQKIYYRSSQYFVFLNSKKQFLIQKKFRLIHFLSDHSEFMRNSHFNRDQYNQKIGLHFSFNQKIRPFYSKILNTKSNLSLFLAFSAHFVSINIRQKFLLNFHGFDKIDSKLKRPVFSRKDYPHSLQGVESNVFWLNFIEPLNLKKTNFHEHCNWFFYKKIKTNKNNDFELPCKKKINVRLKKAKFISGFSNNNIFKVFFNINQGLNQTIFLSLLELKVSNLYNRLYWISHYQSFFLQFNRQGNLKFYLLSSWAIDQDFLYETSVINNRFSQKINWYSLSDFEKKLNWYIKSYSSKKLYRIKKYKKPLLFDKYKNKKLLSDKKPLVGYIIQNIYKAFCQETQKSFNLTAGFKAQIKINTIPGFYSGNYQNTKEKIEKIKFDRSLFFQKTFDYLDKQKIRKFSINKTQTFLSWPYAAKVVNLLSNFNFVLKKGSMAIDGVLFDNHEIIIDFIHLEELNFLKYNLENLSKYTHIININKRFLTTSNNSKKLILFQKTQISAHEKLLLLKKRLLNHNSSRQKTFDLLEFNANRYYSNFFKRTLLKPKISHNSFYAFDQIQPIENRLFQRISLISQIRIKTTISSSRYIFLSSYSPIYKSAEIVFNFRDLNLCKKYKKLDFKYFMIISNLSSKPSHLSSIKKLDFQKIDSKVLKKSKAFQIFYSQLEAPSLKNFLLIKTFVNLINGEIVSVTAKKEKKTFVALTHSDLESVSLNQSSHLSKTTHFQIGKFIRFGEQLENEQLITESGQIIYKDKDKLIMRKAVPFLITARSFLNVSPNEIIEKNARLFTLFYHQIKTGDIIQGIPKIEELFEARVTREGMPLLTNLHIQLKQLFNQYNTNNCIFEATQKSFEKIQQIILDEIQKIYCSQGISISDKHLEIIIRQMTSKVQILEGGQTGLLAGELIEFDWIRLIHQKLVNEDICYEPIILGITKSCLETESFISAASFQETTRILSRAAIQNKVDFVRGLKQNVILGNLVPAGTGFLPFS